MNTMVYIWLSIAVCFLIFEVGHPGLFFFLSFSCGALCAAALSYWAFAVPWQITGFLASAALALYVMRTFFADHTHSGPQTNVYALQGKYATVTVAIPAHGTGRVKIGGEEWVAQSLHDETYAVGTRVKVIRVQGIRLLVEHASH